MASSGEADICGTAAVTIYTDGGCKGNPGPGGWGALLLYKGREREVWGGEALTTNNRMELMAAISALETLKRPCDVDLHTDSQYMRQGITSWIHGWKRNGWKTADRKPVKNVDLWQRLEAAIGRHTVHWHWVKGHAESAGKVTQVTDPADAIDQKLMVALSQAKNFHHKAKVYMSDGNTAAAIAAVREILSLRFPEKAPEADDVRNDARALLDGEP